jgi:hypothetical protein
MNFRIEEWTSLSQKVTGNEETNKVKLTGWQLLRYSWKGNIISRPLSWKNILYEFLQNKEMNMEIFTFLQVPIDAAHLYDAVMIYARALTEVFQNGEDPRNGSAVLQKIRNRSYHSVQGYDVCIPNSGDREQV